MKWLVWSFEHKGWWLQSWSGYTRELRQAGRFSLREALGICNRANQHLGPDSLPEEAMCPDWLNLVCKCNDRGKGQYHLSECYLYNDSLMQRKKQQFGWSEAEHARRQNNLLLRAKEERSLVVIQPRPHRIRKSKS